MSGPFVVTHQKLPEQDGATGCVLSVKAVETLSKAADLAARVAAGPTTPPGFAERMRDSIRKMVLALPAEGGKVALPDGSQVVVEAELYSDLAMRAFNVATAMAYRWMPTDTPVGVRRQREAEIVAGWNDKFGVEAQSEGVR